MGPDGWTAKVSIATTADAFSAFSAYRTSSIYLREQHFSIPRCKPIMAPPLNLLIRALVAFEDVIIRQVGTHHYPSCGRPDPSITTPS